jgi:hypothetical protein
MGHNVGDLLADPPELPGRRGVHVPEHGRPLLARRRHRQLAAPPDIWHFPKNKQRIL